MDFFLYGIWYWLNIEFYELIDCFMYMEWWDYKWVNLLLLLLVFLLIDEDDVVIGGGNIVL